MFKKTVLSFFLLNIINVALAAELNVALEAAPDSLDPQAKLEQGTLQMANWLFDPLVRFNNKQEIVPVLAESWEQISPTTLRFYLRKDVKFHSGNPMTADDVIFSYNRLLRSNEFKGLFSHYDDIRKVDDYTIDVVNNKSYPLILANLSNLFVMDKKFYTGHDKDGNDKSRITADDSSFAANNESGSGPFILASRKKGVQSVFVKNTHYWGKTGNVDKFTLNVIKDDKERVAELLAGKLDWIYPVPPEDLERIKDTKGLGVYSISGDGIITFQLNENVAKPFRDKRVREAVIYSVDNTSIVQQIMHGFATPASQNSPALYSGHNPNLKVRYDLDKAKALMKEAGYENGFTITMISPANHYVHDEKIAQSVADMLSKINIKVELKVLPESKYLGVFTKCTDGMAMVGWVSDTHDSANYSEYLTMTRNTKAGTGLYNCSGFSDSALDNLISHANSLPAGHQRDKLLRQAAQLEYDDAIFLPLHWQNLNWGYNKKITNLPDIVNMENFPLFQNAIVK